MKRFTSLRTYAHMIEGTIGLVLLALSGLANLPTPSAVPTQPAVQQQQMVQAPNAYPITESTGITEEEVDYCNYLIMSNHLNKIDMYIHFDIDLMAIRDHGDYATLVYKYDYLYNNNAVVMVFYCNEYGLFDVEGFAIEGN